MKICPNCQHENNDSSLFCSNCGTHLEESPKQEEQNSEIRFDPLTGERIYGNEARFNQTSGNNQSNSQYYNNDQYYNNNGQYYNNNGQYYNNGNYGYNAQGYRDSNYGLALAGLLVSLLVSPLIGLILSIIAIYKDKRKRYLGLEISGIVIGGLKIILVIIIAIYFSTHLDALEAYINQMYGYIALFL